MSAIRIATSLFLIAGCNSASAATVLATDFTGVIANSTTNTVNSVTWDTVGGIDIPTSSLAFVGNTEDGGGTLGFFSATNLVSVDYNLSNEGSYEFTIPDINLSSGTSAIDLTSLSLDLNATNNSGASQISDRTLELTVDVIGSSSGSIGGGSFSLSEPAGASFTTYTVDLSGLPSLDSSEAYSFAINVDDVSQPGVNAAMDNLVILGDITAIPEPGSLSLLALGSALLCLRRRRI